MVRPPGVETMILSRVEELVMSKASLEPGVRSREPAVEVPTPVVPGERVEPELRVTRPEEEPVPARVARLLTVTGPVPVAEPVELVRVRVPALTVVPPVKVLALVRVREPRPDLVRAREPPA